MRVKIFPSIAKGVTTAPPSKSLTHRYLICAALCDGESFVSPVSFSQDVLATIDCLRALGAEITPFEDGVKVQGFGKNLSSGKRLCCGESGSTLRFLVPLCLLTGKEYTLTGSKRLFERPLTVYENLCREKGFFYEKVDNTLTLSGSFKAGKYTVPGDISSQFITGLLLALSTLDGDSTVEVTGKFESRPYVSLTLSVLSKFGIVVKETEDGFFIPGGQTFCAGTFHVELDLSNAAFLEAYSFLGGDVELPYMPEFSLQGDGVYREHFQALSRGFCTIDIGSCPDLGPVLMAFAALFYGVRLTSTKRLRIKESDRGAAMAEELAKCGVKATVEEDEITVEGGKVSAPKEAVFSHNDHRIVMSFALILSRVGGEILGAEAVEKSFPDFFEKIEKLGINIEK